MLESLALYRRFLGISVRAQMAYRASFLMQAFGNFAITACEFLAIWSLFERFGELRGWTLSEAALLYGLVNVSFAVAEALSFGFDGFGEMLKRGEVDRLLLRPRGLVLQLMGQHLALKNAGRLLQGLAVLGWGAAHAPVAWTPALAANLVL
ncbi:MAG: ABC-2 family transporter protein, partial [Planctomycetota bacterium]|nr:ABC-2 family transporter protein [Planctomycetota bacterium]